MATKTLLPVINLKGFSLTEKTHEKYGVSLEVLLSGKSGKYPNVAVEYDGKPHSMSIGSQQLDDGSWAPVLRLQPIAASLPKEVKETFNTSKVPSAKEMEEYKEFLAFKAMKEQAAAKK